MFQIENGKVMDEFRLLSGWTLGPLCGHAKTVVLLGHIGRPEGKDDPNLSVAPIVEWLKELWAHPTQWINCTF